MKKSFIYILTFILLLANGFINISAKEMNLTKEYFDKGDSCYKLNKFPEALSYFTKSMMCATQYNDSSCYAECLGYTGNIYAVFKDYERANYYFRKAFYSEMSNKKYDMASLYGSNIITTYCLMKKPAEARKFYELVTGIPVAKEIKPIRQFYNIFHRAKIVEAENNRKEAIKLHHEAIAFCKSNNLSDYYITCEYAQLSDLYLADRKYDRALYYADKINKYAEDKDDKYFLVSAYNLKYRIYTEKKDSANMFKYQSKYMLLSDSVFNGMRFNNAQNQLFEYENKVTGDHINYLNHKIRTQHLLIFLVSTTLILIVVILLFIIYHYRKLRRTQQILISKNNELIRLKDKGSNMHQQSLHNTGQETIMDCQPEESIKCNIKNDVNSDLLDKIIAAFENIDMVCSSDFCLEYLADELNSNKTYVSTTINSYYGKPFKAILNEIRINEACKRLTDLKRYGNLTIQAISESVGYNSQSHFIKVFKMQMGVTPSLYRKLSL